MPWWTWIAFGIFLLALVATAVFSAFAFGRLKRLRASAEGIQARVDEVARAAEEVERGRRAPRSAWRSPERHRARTEPRSRGSGADVGVLRGDRRSAPAEALPQEVTRVGVVDLGTNSTRLLVADVEDGTVREVERRLTITRLGEGVDERRLLLPTALARVRNALADYRRVLESRGRADARGATSAVRDAENGEAFLGEIEWSYGFETRLLSGDEEAR